MKNCSSHALLIYHSANVTPFTSESITEQKNTLKRRKNRGEKKTVSNRITFTFKYQKQNIQNRTKEKQNYNKLNYSGRDSKLNLVVSPILDRDEMRRKKNESWN